MVWGQLALWKCQSLNMQVNEVVHRVIVNPPQNQTQSIHSGCHPLVERFTLVIASPLAITLLGGCPPQVERFTWSWLILSHSHHTSVISKDVVQKITHKAFALLSMG